MHCYAMFAVLRQSLLQRNQQAMGARLRSWWQKSRKLLMVTGIIALLAVAVVLIWAAAHAMRNEIATRKLYNTKLLDKRSRSHRLLADHAVEVPSQCSNHESDERRPGGTSLENDGSLHIAWVSGIVVEDEGLGNQDGLEEGSKVDEAFARETVTVDESICGAQSSHEMECSSAMRAGRLVEHMLWESWPRSVFGLTSPDGGFFIDADHPNPLL